MKDINRSPFSRVLSSGFQGYFLIPLECELSRIESLSTPKMKATGRLHLPVVGAVEIPLRGPGLRINDRCMDSLDVVLPIQQEGGESLPHT
jgi:hypothetical protein